MTEAELAESPKPQVWLIKAPSTNARETYTSDLEAAGFIASYIPAIVEEFDTADLEEILLEGAGSWDGVMITSKRGVEGWCRATRALNDLRETSKTSIDLSSVPLYTVGTTSINALTESGLHSNLLPNCSNAMTAKSALLLGEKMLEVLQPASSKQRFLFIRGDKSANDLQPILRHAGHTVHETQVYTTSSNPDIGRYISEAFRSLPVGARVWLVFFSPSTAGYALPHLEALIRSGGNKSCEVKVAAIGEKSRAFLVESGIAVDAIAEEPNSAGLVEAIKEAD